MLRRSVIPAVPHNSENFDPKSNVEVSHSYIQHQYMFTQVIRKIILATLDNLFSQEETNLWLIIVNY